MNNTINIFILAAGFGERLRPITNHLPKPLLPIMGKPVLQNILERVSVLPLNKIGINLHHKKEMIEEWISSRGGFQTRPYVLFPEEQILGTGGALKNAEGFLNEGTFLVHNADILSDINLERLLDHHRSSKNLVTLAVHDHPEFNNVVVDENGFLKNVGAGLRPAPTNEMVAFTGIAVYEPEFLQFLPSGASSVVESWLKAVNAGHKIGTFDVSKGRYEPRHYWSDIGTPTAYSSTVFNLLKAEGETVYVHPSVKGCGNVEISGYVVIEEGCVFDKGVSLRNCILLPSHFDKKEDTPLTPLDRGEVSPPLKKGDIGGFFENCIIGPDFRIDLIEPEVLAASFEDGKKIIGSGGSDRKYYRIKRGKKSSVLMQCKRDDPDFTRQMEYSRFFLKYLIPVPELLEVDTEEKHAVFEDAGDTSLYNWLKCPREEAEIEKMYRDIIDVLANIHTTATDYVADCRLLKNRIFDYEYFRWETDYFLERFVDWVKNIRTADIPEFEEDLNSLAFKADSFPKTIIHRDFQSQNIMVLQNGDLRIIDYQGARMGPSAYDVASLLWDPYYRLEDNLRERLVAYYISKIEDKFDADYFRETLLICRLQRHMQALGAYGFLSSVKGRKYFLKYVPEGLRLLKEDITLLKDEYPKLHELIMRL
ncbi:MAG: phosphotransferase [Nitrospirae bacterium]|nr:phosphotransferase [Nitrospirota bacterium]